MPTGAERPLRQEVKDLLCCPTFLVIILQASAGQRSALAPAFHAAAAPCETVLTHSSVQQATGRHSGSKCKCRELLIGMVQGILGTIPWTAIVFLTLYLQLIGMSDFAASALMSLFLTGTAAGVWTAPASTSTGILRHM